MVELEDLKSYRSWVSTFTEADLNMLIGLCKSIINAEHKDWNSRVTISNGRMLSRHTDNNLDAMNAPDSSTYYPNRQNANL